MPLSDKQNVVLTPYSRRATPSLPESMDQFITDELQRIEATLRSLLDASPQATDTAPDNPRKGLVRYAISPWNPLNNSYSGLVVYNGTAWVQV